LKYNALGR